MTTIQSSGYEQSLLMSINDLLDISKIETGNAPIKSAHYLLKPIVDESQALLAQVAQEKNIEWIVPY